MNKKKTSFYLPRLTANGRRYFIVMLIGVLMNWLLFSAIDTNALNLPLWLDCTGTAYAALLLEPTAGLIVGLINNCYLSIFVYGSNNLLSYFISVVMALFVGIRLRDKDGKINVRRIPSTALLVFLVSTVIAALLTMWRSGGVPLGYWEGLFYHRGLDRGLPNFLACLYGTAVIKGLDTIATVGIVALFYRMTPAKLKYPPTL